MTGASGVTGLWKSMETQGQTNLDGGDQYGLVDRVFASNEIILVLILVLNEKDNFFSLNFKRNLERIEYRISTHEPMFIRSS